MLKWQSILLRMTLLASTVLSNVDTVYLSNVAASLHGNRIRISFMCNSVGLCFSLLFQFDWKFRSHNQQAWLNGLASGSGFCDHPYCQKQGAPNPSSWLRLVLQSLSIAISGRVGTAKFRVCHCPNNPFFKSNPTENLENVDVVATKVPLSLHVGEI